MAENCMIEVTLVSMGPLAEWGPGQIAPVAPPPLGGPASNPQFTVKVPNKCHQTVRKL